MVSLDPNLTLEDLGRILDRHPTVVGQWKRMGVLAMVRRGHRLYATPDAVLSWAAREAEKQTREARNYLVEVLLELGVKARRMRERKPEASEHWAWDQTVSVHYAAGVLRCHREGIWEAVDLGLVEPDWSCETERLPLREVRSLAVHWAESRQRHAATWLDWVTRRVLDRVGPALRRAADSLEVPGDELAFEGSESC